MEAPELTGVITYLERVTGDVWSTLFSLLTPQPHPAQADSNELLIFTLAGSQRKCLKHFKNSLKVWNG